MPDITSLKEVKRALQNEHFDFTKWFDLGLSLELYQPTLSAIQNDHPNNTERCLDACLTDWLKKKDGVISPTWISLVTALNECEYVTVADSIRKKYV